MCFTFILGWARRILGWAGPTCPPLCYALGIIPWIWIIKNENSQLLPSLERRYIRAANLAHILLPNNGVTMVVCIAASFLFLLRG
jgi:hypothetical protein